MSCSCGYTVSPYHIKVLLVNATKPEVKYRFHGAKIGNNNNNYSYSYYTILMSLSQAFLPGTSLEPAVIPTAQI